MQPEQWGQHPLTQRLWHWQECAQAVCLFNEVAVLVQRLQILVPCRLVALRALRFDYAWPLERCHHTSPVWFGVKGGQAGAKGAAAAWMCAHASPPPPRVRVKAGRLTPHLQNVWPHPGMKVCGLSSSLRLREWGQRAVNMRPGPCIMQPCKSRGNGLRKHREAHSP